MAEVQLAGSEIHGFRTFQDLDIGNIAKEAGGRWLGGHEVYAILCNYKHFCVYSSPVNLPKSGAILLFDRKRLRNFRKDGHNWKKKKDGKTVEESHECLKVGNEERIHVYYVHGQDNPTFARRCYWLLDKNPERDIVLVHYRELKEESGDRHVYYAGDKDFLDGVSCFDQSNQIEMMSQRKRQREDVKAQAEGSGSKYKRRRLPVFKKVVWEVMKMQSVQNLVEPILEPLIRRVVKEEIERGLLKNMKHNCGTEATTSGSRSLQVNFIDNLSPPVFSGAGIEGEDCSNIHEALVDARVEQPLSYDGEASSSHLGNVHYPASLPRTAESPNGPKFLASGEIGEFDHTQHHCAPSPDIFSIIFSVESPSGLAECGLQDLSFPGSMICDTHPMCNSADDECTVNEFKTRRNNVKE